MNNKTIENSTLNNRTKELLKDAGIYCTKDLAINFFYDECDIWGIGEKRKQEIEDYLTQEGWRCHPDGFEKLYFAIFGKPEKNEILPIMLRSSESNSLFYDALDTLTEREQLIIKDFYGIDREYSSIEDISNKYNISGERVRHILLRALRKLNCDNLRNISYSWRELALLHDSDRKEVERLTAENKKLKTVIDIAERAGLLKAIPCLSIDSLELSVRAYNCLRRAGIETTGQLEKMTHDDIYRIKYLGRKYAEEVIEKLEALRINPTP